MLKPIIKYPGGKERELKIIIPNMPSDVERYFEPFLGGGALFFAIDTPALVNDKSEELIGLYKSIAKQDKRFLALLDRINTVWEKVSIYSDTHITEWLDCYRNGGNMISCNNELLIYIHDSLEIGEKTPDDILKSVLEDKLRRAHKIEAIRGKMPDEDVVANVECAIKRGIYTYLRNIYNQPNLLSSGEKNALFLFQREFCYSSMFRYNAIGEFNVPYGGISYNRKNFRAKIAYIKNKELVAKLQSAVIECMDFYKFMRIYQPGPKDFVFLDPPYDTDFSEYAGNAFGTEDQRRLADYLINECRGRWQIVIKATNYIRSLYPVGKLTVNGGVISVKGFDKRYSVSFMDRNVKDCEHLLITNYEV